jgi:deoxyhypusine synthase
MLLARATKIAPEPIRPEITLADLVDNALLAYNGARLREACQLFTSKALDDDVTVGMSLTGALTPAGLGMSAIIPLVEAGFVDWIASTGANLYHDIHFAIGRSMHRATPFLDDRDLYRDGVVRIYDVVFDYEVLLSTDAFCREVIASPEFRRPMGTAEFHFRLGKYVAERERALGTGGKSLLAAAFHAGVPVYTPSPGDSSIGMNVAALALDGGDGLQWDLSRDVNETAALVYGAKRRGGKSAVVIVGGGSPKNFLLQTEPHIREILGLEDTGHDYFIQFTDARPDTGGLSGATPAEAVSWGKVDPTRLPDAVVCYCDATIALPIFAAYALTRRAKRPLRRLYDQREALLDGLRAAVRAAR